MPKFIFSAHDPAKSTITDSATGAVAYVCTSGGRSESSHTITVRRADGNMVGMCDDSSFTTKVVFQGRMFDLKEFLPRKGLLTE